MCLRFCACKYIFAFHLKIVLCKYCVLSIQLPPPTLYDCCVPPPPNPSFCCTASVHGALSTVPVESPVSVHYLISGGIDCGDSLIHIHIQYKHNWSSAEHWGGGMLKKDLHTYNRSQAFLWNKNCVCKKEQNALLIRMWHGAIFPWSQLLSTEHYQQSGKGSERHCKNVILSYLCTFTSGIMWLAVLILHFFFSLHEQTFPSGMIK